MKTLLIDKTRESLAPLHELLQARGYDVSFSTEKEGWEKAAAGAGLVFLGAGLDRKNVLNIARRLRALPGGKHSLVLAVSTQPPVSELDALLEAGVDDYILIADDREPLPARLKVVERQAHQAFGDAAVLHQAAGQDEQRDGQEGERVDPRLQLHGHRRDGDTALRHQRQDAGQDHREGHGYVQRQQHHERRHQDRHRQQPDTRLLLHLQERSMCTHR